jgi:tellurite resistance protein
VFGAEDVLIAFADISRRFEEDHEAGEREALRLAGELRSRRRHARLLMETCCAIAGRRRRVRPRGTPRGPEAL